MLLQQTLISLLAISQWTVLASGQFPENCCTLASEAYSLSQSAIQNNNNHASTRESCFSIPSPYGTLGYQCKKGTVIYNGHDLLLGQGDDQITMHIAPDSTPNGGQFTVVMSCTGKSGTQQVAKPLYCPTLSSKQMVALGPIFKEPCKDEPKVMSVTPQAGYQCAF